VLEENNKLSEKITSLSEELTKKQKKELESELLEKKKDLYIENSIPDLLEVRFAKSGKNIVQVKLRLFNV
jgi:hypothetical protein